MKQKHFDLLAHVLAQPTAPFREKAVVLATMNELAHAGVPHFLDPIGNVIVGAGSPAEYRKVIQSHRTEPVRLLLAHMDHPGFIGKQFQQKGQALEVDWYGGSPVKHLLGTEVYLANQKHLVHPEELPFAQIKKVRLNARKTAIQGLTLELPDRIRESLSIHKTKARDLYGCFRFKRPVWEKQQFIYTPAADDLVGIAVIILTAIDLMGKKRKFKSEAGKIPFLGILTRAEEVGFIGWLGHLQLGWLKNAPVPPLVVSLEASRAFPGAEIGKGPVVRLGDRSSVFDPTSLQHLSTIARDCLPDNHQKRIMDGGTCEASASIAYGFPSVGISIPLGNYHNIAPEGPPAPEYVHRGDVEGMIQLCISLILSHQFKKDPWKPKRIDLDKTYARYQSLL